MAKKEKAPKEKKPKKEKPKKEKPPKKPKKGKGGAEGTEEGGKGKKKGFNKLFLILIPVVLSVAAAGVLFFTGVIGGKRGETPPDTEGTEETEGTEGTEGTEEGEEGEEGEETEGTEEGSGDGETDPEEELPEEEPEPVEPALQIRSTMTTSEIVSFVQHLSPKVLGLEGEDMSAYTVFASEGVTLVDGNTCARVNVYSKGEKSGTNDIEGVYFLTRYGTRRLYEYNQIEGTVREIPLSGKSVLEALPEDERALLEAEMAEGEPEEEPEEAPEEEPEKESKKDSKKK